ncbi:MAG: AAA family ATPase, partial [Steroidobacteraceae bacterium]
MSLEQNEANARPARGRPNVLTVAVAGQSNASREPILNALKQVTEPPVAVLEAQAASADEPPDMVIIALGDDPDTWQLQIEDLAQSDGSRPSVIAAITERSGDAVRKALRAGADDVFFLPAEPIDLSRCLVRVGETRRHAGGRRATICALTSVAGGAGVTTLTAALGFALMRLGHQRVALIDLGLQCGALAALLDLNPEHTISELMDPTTTVDSIRLEASLAAHASGLYLLAAPKRVEESEMVSVNTVTAVLDLMRELFDFILIDCGHHMSETLVAAWERSRHLLYVVEQGVTSVRPAQRFLEMFGRLNLAELQPEFILNRYVATNPFSIEKIEAALHAPVSARIPR